MGETTARLRSKGGGSSGFNMGENNTLSESTAEQQFFDSTTTTTSSSSANNNESSWRNTTILPPTSSSSLSIFQSWRRRALFARFIASLSAIIIVVVLVLRSSSSSRQSSSSSGHAKPTKLVPPIRGQAYLTPDEFLNIRESYGNESVLITGGLGFIGSHVVDLLLHRGFMVTILDDESNGHNHNDEAVELVPRDVSVVNDLPSYPTMMTSMTTTATTTTEMMMMNDIQGQQQENTAGRGNPNYYYTHVIHLAAAISVSESMTNPEKYERINYQGSQNVLDWILGYNSHVASMMSSSSTLSSPGSITTIRKVVAASSAAIYGDPPSDLLPLQESAPYGGLSPYAETKYRMEGLMRDFVLRQNEEKLWSSSSSSIIASQSSSPPSTITTTSTTTSAIALRFFNVYGPRQDPKNPYSGVISLFLDMATSGNDITILGDGQMTRDFVYVKDVARAIVLALLQDDDDDAVSNNNEEERDDGTKEEGGGLRPLLLRNNEATFNVYNVCTGKSITINTLAERVRTSMKSSSTIVHLDPREGDIRESSCNPSGAEDGIGFRYAVSQESGLEKTAAWFRMEMEKKKKKKKKKKK